MKKKCQNCLDFCQCNRDILNCNYFRPNRHNLSNLMRDNEHLVYIDSNVRDIQQIINKFHTTKFFFKNERIDNTFVDITNLYRDIFDLDVSIFINDIINKFQSINKTEIFNKFMAITKIFRIH